VLARRRCKVILAVPAMEGSLSSSTAAMEHQRKGAKTRGIEGRENKRRGTNSFGTRALGYRPSGRAASRLGWRGELEFLLPIISRHRRERRARRTTPCLARQPSGQRGKDGADPMEGYRAGRRPGRRPRGSRLAPSSTSLAATLLLDQLVEKPERLEDGRNDRVSDRRAVYRPQRRSTGGFERWLGEK
jgi:hypothetical protein